jgi:uncharacterized protein
MTDIVIVSGAVELTARLLDTPTAHVIARALPLNLTAIFWGRLIRLEAPLDAYRERGATQLAQIGQILWSPEREDIVIPYGATPISRAGEIRLTEPSNIWAQILGDVQALREVPDGAKVVIAQFGSIKARTAPPSPTGRWRP